MRDRAEVIKGLEVCVSREPGGDYICYKCPYEIDGNDCEINSIKDAIALLKEQEKKRITLHKNHTITLRRNDKFSMRELYEAICETLLDEGELFIERTDNHEKVDFLFYVAEGR